MPSNTQPLRTLPTARMRMREGLITAPRHLLARYPQPRTLEMPQLLALFWTPYADWIYTVMSTAGLLLIVWLVLKPRT